MKTLLIPALALALLAGCGGGSDDKADTPAPASTTAPGPAAPDNRETALKVAAQGYVNSLLKGDVVGVTGYLDPKVCDDDDRTGYAFTVPQMKETAGGATMKITKVYVEGDRGGVEDYTLSGGAPDQLRRLIKSSFEGSKTYSWRYHDGEWYLAGPCEGDASASPTP
jgi:hypothetical protein